MDERMKEKFKQAIKEASGSIVSEAIEELDVEDVEKLIEALIRKGYLETMLKQAHYEADSIEFDKETEVSLRQLRHQFIVSDQASDDPRNIFFICERKDEAYMLYNLLCALLKFRRTY